MQKLSLLMLIAPTVFISACAVGPQVKSYVGPTGETINTVRCTREPSSCFEKASETCNADSYRIINSYRNAGGTLADIVPGPVTWYTMDVVCGQSDGIMPQFPLRGAQPSMPNIPSTQQTRCRQMGNKINCTTY